MESFKEAAQIVFMAFFIGVVILGGIVGIGLLMDRYNTNRDAECKQKFGQEYKYTVRTGIDCINPSGDGKFLYR